MSASLALMRATAQKSIYMYGCFNVRCIRATFRKVSSIKINIRWILLPHDFLTL